MKLFVNDGIDEIVRNVNIILETPKYSCPLHRNFGLDALFLDAPIEKSKAMMRAEITEQIEKYEPRVSIKSISFEVDPQNGRISPKVVLDIKQWVVF